MIVVSGIMLFALPKDKNGPKEAGSQGKPSIKLAGAPGIVISAVVCQLGVPPLRLRPSSQPQREGRRMTHPVAPLPRTASERSTGGRRASVV